MSGLISLQISITGNIEKDQQILIYGIGGLIGLIVLAMITIVVIVLVRRGRRTRAAQAAAMQAAMAEPQAETPIQEQPQEMITAEEPTAEAKAPDTVQVEEKPKKEEEKVTVVPEKKPEPDERFRPVDKPEQKKEDKLEEIRRRLEEIRSQKSQNEPVPVLPKIEATPITTVESKQAEEPQVAEKTEDPIGAPVEETVLLEDTESVVSPVAAEDETAEEVAAQEQEAPVLVEDEGIMKEIYPEENIPEEEIPEPEPVSLTGQGESVSAHLPNGKFLPMKKMTFAEWVELFK